LCGFNCTCSGSIGILCQFDQSSYHQSFGLPYVPTTLNTPTSVALGDEELKMIPIGFTFYFFDQAYTSLGLSSNGFFTFEIFDPDFHVIPSAFQTKTFAFYGDDLVPTSVSYQLFGNPGSRFLAISYSANFWSSTTFAVACQIKLYEVDNRIEVHYSDMASPLTRTIQKQIGLENDVTHYLAIPSSPQYKFSQFTIRFAFDATTTGQCPVVSLPNGIVSYTASSGSVFIRPYSPVLQTMN